jgi:hypothetical protein
MTTLEEKRIALASQCMGVARMATQIANVNWELAVLHASAPEAETESFIDMVGKFSHERMESLANILNGMDAVEHEDAERSEPIFERARRLFPLNPEQ